MRRAPLSQAIKRDSEVSAVASSLADDDPTVHQPCEHSGVANGCIAPEPLERLRVNHMGRSDSARAIEANDSNGYVCVENAVEELEAVRHDKDLRSATTLCDEPSCSVRLRGVKVGVRFIEEHQRLLPEFQSDG